MDAPVYYKKFKCWILLIAYQSSMNQLEERNFIQLGSEPILHKPANSRLGTKSEKVMRFWDKRGLRRLFRADARGRSQEPIAKSPAWCRAWGCLKACWAGLRSLFWRGRRDCLTNSLSFQTPCFWWGWGFELSYIGRLSTQSGRLLIQ